MSLFDHGCRNGDGHIHDLLHHLVHQNEQILRNTEIIMSTQPTTTDLDNAIGSVETAVAKLGTDLQNAISDLEAKVTAAPPQTFDPTPEIARLKAVAASLASLDTSAVAADPGAPASTTPPADTGTQNPPASSTGTDTTSTSDADATSGSADSGTSTPAA